jgi:hypothetical protein
LKAALLVALRATQETAQGKAEGKVVEPDTSKVALSEKPPTSGDQHSTFTVTVATDGRKKRGLFMSKKQGTCFFSLSIDLPLQP